MRPRRLYGYVDAEWRRLPGRRPLAQSQEDRLSATPNALPDVGAPLPDFSLAGTDGATHSVADLVRDHRGLVLFYFPKANTDG